MPTARLRPDGGADATEYPSAAAALTAAATLGGGTVLLGAGTYREGTLHVPAGVSLLGEGAGSTVVEGSDGSAIVCAGSAVRVANLEARQPIDTPKAPAYALEVRGAAAGDGVSIDGCRLVAVSAARLSAAVLVHGSSASLSACTLEAPSSHGAVLAARGALRVSGGELARCGGCGFLVLSSCALTAEGVAVRGCRESALLLSGKAASATLRACELSGERAGGGGGEGGGGGGGGEGGGGGGGAGHASVSVRAGARATLEKCTIDSPAGSGVQVGEGERSREESRVREITPAWRPGWGRRRSDRPQDGCEGGAPRRHRRPRRQLAVGGGERGGGRQAFSP